MSSIRTFQNVRIRLRREATGEPLSGWVSHLSRDAARVRMWTNVALSEHETLTGECYGQGAVARFCGRVLTQAECEVAMQVVGSISYAPSEETPRICAIGLAGRLDARGVSSALRILDVSPMSLGGLVEANVRPGDELEMNLPTEMGPIAAKVSVANCRPDAGAYRVGLHIVDMARLDRARWGRLVMERAEA